MRLIDADKLKKEVMHRAKWNDSEDEGVARLAIDNQEIVDAKPVIHAHWEIGYFNDRVCSHCIHPSNDLGENRFDYCPWCGAKMDEEDKHETD